MKYLRLRLHYTFLLFITLFTTYSQADAPVWKITKGDKHLFIGGTIHLLNPKDYPLPPAFSSAYQQSDLLITEADTQQLKESAFQQRLLSQVSYPQGENLKQHISGDTLKALEQYCSDSGFPLAHILGFKPGMASMVLTMFELQKLGLVGTGVDEFFSLKAINDKKERQYLETVEEQISFINNMGQGREDALIKYTLKDMKQLKSKFLTMKAAWREGDLKTLSDLALNDLKRDFPTIYNTLLLERNNAWIPKIEAMLKTQEVELVLFGALHLVGNNSVLKQLEDRGFKIKRVTAKGS